MRRLFLVIIFGFAMLIVGCTHTTKERPQKSASESNGIRLDTFQNNGSTADYATIPEMADVHELPDTVIKDSLDSADVHHTTSWQQPIYADTIRVLAIGNSYSQDALSYLPVVMRGLDRNVCLVLGIAFIPSCSLQMHWDNFRSESHAYEYDKYDCRIDSAYSNIKNYSLNDIIIDEPWDIVTFQQVSSKSYEVKSIAPYLKKLIDATTDSLHHRPRIGWILTPSYADGFKGMPRMMDSDEMHRRICLASLRVEDSGLVDFVVPVGTAIQNARHTMFDNLGNVHHLSSDGKHTQEGLGCLLEANVAAKTFLHIMGLDARSECFIFRIVDQWIKQANIPGPHGKVIGMSVQYGDFSNFYFTFSYCVNNAIAHPYRMTTTPSHSWLLPSLTQQNWLRH